MAALARFGRVDVLLNLAGVLAAALIQPSGDDDLNKMLDINLRTTYNLCRAAIKTAVAQQWGADCQYCFPRCAHARLMQRLCYQQNRLCVLT
ncbi:MAG: SDR family NAD(P)-dependent oxidoreductase [Anaerolineae bacterium]